MFCRYECTCCLAAFMFMWIERIAMSSAYVISFILLFGGVWMSDVYILNRAGESTSPVKLCFYCCCFDFVLLYSVNCLRPGMQFHRNFMTVFCCVNVYSE